MFKHGKAEGFRDGAAKEFCMDWVSGRMLQNLLRFLNSCSC